MSRPAAPPAGQPPPKPLSRPLALAAAATALVAAALLPFAAPRLAALPACPLRAASGWPCPACGSGRALTALAAGQPLVALAANPLAVAGLVGLGLLGLAAGAAELAGRPLHEPRELSRPLRLALVALFAANWLYLVRRGL